MKVLVLGFLHETNAFNRRGTTRADFEAFSAQGRASLPTRDLRSGIRRSLSREWRYVDGDHYEALPGTGAIQRDAVEWMIARCLQTARTTRPDAVVLNVHGGAVDEDGAQPEVELLARVRRDVGEACPIAVIHDPHGNVTADWTSQADLVLSFKTTPHVDQSQTGSRVGAWLTHSADRERHKPILRRLPILLKGGLMSGTSASDRRKPPFGKLSSVARRLERESRAFDISINPGSAAADGPFVGLSIVVNANSDLGEGHRAADIVSRWAWNLRPLMDPAIALKPVGPMIDLALASSRRPTVLVDEGNDPGLGGGADDTTVMREMLLRNWPNAAVVICDATAYADCRRRTVGAELTLKVGDADRTGARPSCVLVGRKAGDGRLPGGSIGRVAVVRCGQTDVVITEDPERDFLPSSFASLGIEPSDKQVLVIQAGSSTRRAIATGREPRVRLVSLDTPGPSNPDPRRFEYHRVARPAFPLDPSVDALDT